jgi:hypothetical protein
VTAGPIAIAVVLALGGFGAAGYVQHESARAALRRRPLSPRLLLDLLADRRFTLSLALSAAA